MPVNARKISHFTRFAYSHTCVPGVSARAAANAEMAAGGSAEAMAPAGRLMMFVTSATPEAVDAVEAVEATDAAETAPPSESETHTKNHQWEKKKKRAAGKRIVKHSSPKGTIV